MLTMHPTLLAMDAEATPEVVRGVQGHVFDALPRAVRAREDVEGLVDNAFNNACAVTVRHGDVEGVRRSIVPSSCGHSEVPCTLC